MQEQARPQETSGSGTQSSLFSHQPSITQGSVEGDTVDDARAESISKKPRSEEMRKPSTALNVNAVDISPSADLGRSSSEDLYMHRKRTRDLVEDHDEAEFLPPAKRLHIMDDGTTEKVDLTDDEAENSSTSNLSDGPGWQDMITPGVSTRSLDFANVAPTSEQEM